MKQILLFISISFWMIHSGSAFSQGSDKHSDDSVFIRKIYDEALSKGKAYENLRVLCKEIGARITGSTEAQMAIEWGHKLMTDYGFKVRLMEITVPHWERGNKEAFWMRKGDGTITKLNGLALGGSVES